MDDLIGRIYGNRVRLRICGICWWNNSLLLVNHSGMRSGDFWSPPGGGIEFGQTVAETLVREFVEETGIKIEPGRFLFTCEFIKHPLHAVELFFEVKYLSGTIKTGIDPELKEGEQIIKNVQWMTVAEIKNHPKEDLHGIFKFCDQPEDIVKLSGFWHIN